MQDHMMKATVPGVRMVAAITTALTEEARQRHDCYPVVAAALGRTMTAALLMAANLKTEERLSIRIAGDGPIGSIIADASAKGRTVRGYVKNPHVDLPLHGVKLDVGTAVGGGSIFVTRFTGLKQPFTGNAPLVSGEIAEDITNYLAVSEQTPSSVALGVLVQPDMTVSASGGFLVQALPAAEEKSLQIIEKNLARLSPVSQMISSGYCAADIINTVFEGLPIKLYDQQPVSFHCPCTRNKVQEVLISLGKKELTELAAEGKAEICCHFCAKKYYFDRSDLGKMLAE
ncbi:33 kDa chaperonin [Propionispora sp. 2/2-37]|uniref:Hsp33 family molecular chaperone HslO n=1 Tax=Propionispora sp. 2/2-37 TaxID=1677858 RepID=UPI0006BB74AE|nr:Hsp33 family molecular chaperone HslO [Propionispora sp. 2/2-37]CUH94229.1 33 kDa chaperonin [Propionispora sp. 2/2-37]